MKYFEDIELTKAKPEDAYKVLNEELNSRLTYTYLGKNVKDLTNDELKDAIDNVYKHLKN